MIITDVDKDPELSVEKAKMLGSLLYFIQCFYFFRTGRSFNLSNPPGRESHHIIVCRELTNIFYQRTFDLLINLPPGHYKSTMLQHFVAWCWAHYPDCQFLYLSYSHDEAAKNTAIIKDIVNLPQYREFFGISIDNSSSAKDNFKTSFGGGIRAFGSGGAVTGKDAGFPGCDRFSGALIMDDMHKPDEVHSDTMREGVINNYGETIAQRVRGPKVASIFLGQCLHEDDLAAFFKAGKDGKTWTQVVLKGLDEANNALDPSIRTKEQLITLQKLNPYVFYAQYQQNPQPAGGGIFKSDDFRLIDEEPALISTFITCDSAETDKNWNDATVFSFWGIYKIKHKEIETGLYGLHWIDCAEIRVEPKNLEGEFLKFYAEAMHHKVKPKIAGIEKKSTGVTLISVLKGMPGLKIIDIERTKASGNKTARFLQAQPYIAAGQVSLMRNARHTKMCIEHMSKITANDTHRHDDIADTAYDAIKMGLIDQIIPMNSIANETQKRVLSSLIAETNRIQHLRDNAYA